VVFARSVASNDLPQIVDATCLSPVGGQGVIESSVGAAAVQ
jgi:hypothetical protein